MHGFICLDSDWKWIIWVITTFFMWWKYQQCLCFILFSPVCASHWNSAVWTKSDLNVLSLPTSISVVLSWWTMHLNNRILWHCILNNHGKDSECWRGFEWQKWGYLILKNGVIKLSFVHYLFQSKSGWCKSSTVRTWASQNLELGL